MKAGKCALVLIFAVLALSVTAEDAKKAASLCAPYYDELISKGKATRTGDAASAQLLPLDPSADLLRAAIAADKSGILVETVFFLPRPAPAGPLDRRAELARIYGLLRSFSTLEGIQYYSVSHKSMRVLYAESYRIDGPETRLRLPDPPAPLPAEMPGEETLFAFQRDLSFGANTYSYVFNSYAEAVSTEMTNLTRLNYGILPLVAPKALKTRLLVIPASDGIVFYTESDSSSPGPFKSRLAESFSNRATALFAWFSSKSPVFLER
ncbi:MAG: DUF6675 family protein [Rectinemataceae bacterium]